MSGSEFNRIQFYNDITRAAANIEHLWHLTVTKMAEAKYAGHISDDDPEMVRLREENHTLSVLLEHGLFEWDGPVIGQEDSVVEAGEGTADVDQSADDDGNKSGAEEEKVAAAEEPEGEDRKNDTVKEAPTASQEATEEVSQTHEWPALAQPENEQMEVAETTELESKKLETVVEEPVVEQTTPERMGRGKKKWAKVGLEDEAFSKIRI